MSLRQLFAVPPPDASPDRWHVSPGVDVCAYALSWLWVLLPMALAGDSFEADYLAIYILVLVVTQVHRHYTMPYVFLDRQTYSRFPLRFTLVPLVMFALWAGTPFFKRSGWSVDAFDWLAAIAWLLVLVKACTDERDGDGERGALAWVPSVRQSALPLVLLLAAALPTTRAWLGRGGPAWVMLAAAASVWIMERARRSGPEAEPGVHWKLPLAVTGLAVLGLGGPELTGVRTIPANSAISVAAVAAGAWTYWHVHMQKYGILRLYSAKSGNADKVPGWVDRLVIFGWLPLLILWIGTHFRGLLFEMQPRAKETVGPMLEQIDPFVDAAMVPAVGLVIVSLGLLLVYEWRCNRLRNAPRLWMVLGTVGMYAAFLVLHPLKAYLAFAFSHAVEYMVFVWAYQRRRYREPLPHRPLLGRLLSRPLLAYGVFTLGLSGYFVLFKYWGRYIFRGADVPYFVGITTSEWIFYWTIFQSFLHFYYDGFLWKMRKKSVRANL